MKFLHTADWHIGLKAAHLGGAGARVRAERLRAARRVIGAANECGVDAVIVAGDVFDDNCVRPEAVKEAVAILEASAAPVYIIPGNHDYLCAGSVWEHDGWGRSGKIRILADNAPVDIGEAVLYPCPVRERRSVADPTAWIPVNDGGKIKIAIAHGSVEGLPKDDLDFPIPRSLPERKKLDYAILGHWHSFSRFENNGVCRMAYSGSHETDKFGKPDSGCAALVTIEGRGAVPVVERIDTGELTWIGRREKIDGAEAIAAVYESVMEIYNKDSTLVKLILSGVYGIDGLGVLNDLRAIGESGQFLYYDVNVDDLRIVHEGIGSDTGWLGGISETLVKKAGERIVEMIDADDGAVEKAVLDRALLELYMVCGVGGVSANGH